MSDRLRLATATGLPFLFLAFHVATGLAALGAGFIALATRKGGAWHRVSGLVFVYAMTATGVVAAGIAAYEGNASVTGGLLAAYLVFTAYTTVRPLRRAGRSTDVILMALALTLTVLGYTKAIVAFGRPGHQLDGIPAGMIVFMTTVGLFAAVGDARLIRAGSIRGPRRLARHLWRMCFGLFIASGSFLLGQMRFVPEPIRIVPLLVVLAVSPLIALIYWMWRVRLRQNLRGVLTVQASDAQVAPLL